MGRTRKKEGEPTVVKKYANRRLYDTGRSSYVTLDDLCEMVKENHDFVVQDAKTGEDLTRSVLTQIIVEQESKGENNLLPVAFLRQLIAYYGDNLQTVVPDYLEQTLETFTKNQEQFRDQMNKSLEGMIANPVSTLEEINRQNMAMFEKAMSAWSPFSGTQSNSNEDALKQKISELEAEIEKLSR
ncbi:MAG: polyhydroxyalkanoate synthesis repressor PhaR [Alphaproteobacteria bacterium]|jgi:polyhydroxyalkanoate synthesis repressor PhaR|nr:polyhydroxyalkanoate synthesis repressor PhaR [Alphaproteobacteria bacterium]MDP7222837.1 polyhydroxyalkanoate synthesis repressor PhaR [Alphaproteobacteria bacterium]